MLRELTELQPAMLTAKSLSVLVRFCFTSQVPSEAFAKRTCAGVPPLLSGLAGRRRAGFADFRLSHGAYFPHFELLRADSGRHPASASARLRLMAVHNSCRWQALRLSPM